MKTIGFQAIQEDPNKLRQLAAAGERFLITDHGKPVFLTLSLDDDLLEEVHVPLALHLYEEGVLTLGRSAKLAKMSVEAFMKLLAALGVVVVDQPPGELAADLRVLGE